MMGDHDNHNPYAAPQDATDETIHVEPEGELQPFKTIWTSPRVTVRRIIAVNPDMHVLLLACLAGIGNTLNRASTRNAGDEMPLLVILLLSVVLGPLGGLFSLYVGAALLRLTGRWIGGTGIAHHLRTAMAWAYVPSVAALVLWVPLILLLGDDMFTEATPRLDAQPLLWIPFLAMVLVGMVAGFWTLVLLCNTIAEVQGFRSAWAGFGNMLLAGMVLFVPLMLIVMLALLV